MAGESNDQGDRGGLPSELARGEDPRTPFLAIAGVNVVVALLVLAIVALVVLAVWLA
jgi:hypothetical protein